MGNTLKGLTGRGQSSSKSDQRRAKNIYSKLAPTTLCEKGPECPICFTNFNAVNEVVCCKQTICTGCYINISESAAPACPFCSVEKFAAVFNASLQQNVDLKIVSSESNESALSSSPNSVADSLTVTPKSSIQDRLALEAEIRTQRREYDSEYPYQSSQSPSSWTRSTVSNSNLIPMLSRMSLGADSGRSTPQTPPNPSSTLRSSWLNRFTQPSPRDRNRGANLANSNSGSAARGSNSSSSSGASNVPSPSFLASSPGNSVTAGEGNGNGIDQWSELQHVLQSEDIILSGLQNFQDIEEIMMMEAIRQSLLESSTGNSTTTEVQGRREVSTMSSGSRNEVMTAKAPSFIPMTASVGESSESERGSTTARIAHIDPEDNEDEQLELALAMSRLQSSSP